MQETPVWFLDWQDPLQKGTVACQASLSLTIYQSLPKFMFIALMMPSSHLIL